jgi:hypothetical protein
MAFFSEKKARANRAAGLCACGQPPLLTLDHIDNDGAEDRRPHGKDLYAGVIKQGFPSKFQPLCWNHQWKKRMLLLRGEEPPKEVCVGAQCL